MNYEMTTPCDQCPFLKGSGFTWESLMAHSSGEFPCHKTCKLDEDESIYVPRNENTPHCAGALIFRELIKQPHQMMRICERLGMYDRRKLDMRAPVVAKPSDCRKPEKSERRRIFAK